MNRQKARIVFPAVDLGGSKIAFAFMKTGKHRGMAKHYPPSEVVQTSGLTDAKATLKRVAALIKKRTREMEKEGWTVLKLVGMGAPGLYREDGSVDPVSVPNIPGLSEIKPADFLESLLGGEWKVFVENDGVVQAVAAGHMFVHSPDFRSTWLRLLTDGGGRLIYFGPGTGFGAGKVYVDPEDRLRLLPGSQAFFDILVRGKKTAEDLIGGRGIGKIAQQRERRNLEKKTPVLLTFVPGYASHPRQAHTREDMLLNRITTKTVAEAFYSKDPAAGKLAGEIFETAGRDLAGLIIKLYEGKVKKTALKWDKSDRDSVKGTGIFLAAGLLIKPIGKALVLPAARDVLKKSGYAEKINIVELDSLPRMKTAKGKIGIYGASLIVPESEIQQKMWAASLVSGTGRVDRFISDRVNGLFRDNLRPVLLAMDGYTGIEWKKSTARLKKKLEKDGIRVTAIAASTLYKSRGRIEKSIRSCLTDEKTFGRLYTGKLSDFIDEKKAARLKARFEKAKSRRSSSPTAILCYGIGAACKELADAYDIIFYKDLTREEINNRSKKGLLVPLGAGGTAGSGKGPAYLAGKRFYYVDYPVLDKHRKALKKKIDFYIDDNLPGRPKLIEQKMIDEMIADLSGGPFQLKVYHDIGVWGGQWLKKIRNLQKEMINCAWAYELMAYHMSVKIPVGDSFIETPFSNLLDREADRIMGEPIRKRFKGMWPIRVNYDDCLKGGDMAVQIHPDADYIEKNFREPLHQDESYYIVAAAPDAYVYLGLKENVDISEFQDRVLAAETENIAFDHREYVNVFPAGEGDLFLIPAGTVHASGKGCVVLELSATTDRYTFHFYDYLRPDLHGGLRDIHSIHAFGMLEKYPHRRTSWVKKHLLQKPKIIRKGKGWAEYRIGGLDGYIPEIKRYIINTAAEDNTNGAFHVLSMVKGDRVVILPAQSSKRKFDLKFTETVILPACLGSYRIVNPADEPCTVLKTTVNPSLY
jgi:mannose-6-phosphate isomerase class I